MNAWEFSASIIGSLAWPTVIIVIAVIYRNQLQELCTRLASLRYRELQVDFGQTLTRVEQAVEVESADATSAPTTQLLQPNVNPIDRFAQLASISPSSAVIEAWIDVENTLTTMAQHHGINLQRGRSPLYLTRLMCSAGIIDRRTAEALDDLRMLRNAAVHNDGTRNITTEDALRFKELSNEVIRILATSSD